ncbi:glycosyltransferase family 2 protein [Kutzneria buriramensis]|uniref:GT2 family glycosyltransferase n=1 Tax=Kutzneria buriramensis TaxID=1045776 RepID=A0A3E0ICA7_9PSEU|nr:glycosyltransferase [Kutzneria buriramensis]REH55805.1 GT2 family glycosyltransferase [Kutzneria buriramensis]
MPGKAQPVLRTAPVLAVLVCHDGEAWLRLALSALRRSTPRPRHVIAVDTGSRDRTSKLLAEAASGDKPVLDGVLTMSRGTGFGDAVRAAVGHAIQRWGDPGRWLWLLHDDSAPEPDCLAALLAAAEMSPAAGVLGPLGLDWNDPTTVVSAGLSTDSSGHRQTGISTLESAQARFFEQSTESLAVASAGSLIARELWSRLDGYDPVLPMLGDDLDFGWRANKAGSLVLSVPTARLRHVRAASVGERRLDALAAPPGPFRRGVERAHGVRTFLVNCALPSFLIGLPRLVLLCLLRAMGFLVLRRVPDARAELGAVRYLLSGRGHLLSARADRRRTSIAGQKSVRGLFTSRLTRLRNAIRSGLAVLVRRRVQADAVLGRLPAPETARTAWLDPEDSRNAKLPVGPQALPAGALRGAPRRPAGLRRPAAVVVPVAAQTPMGMRPSPRPRPSPRRRGEEAPNPLADLMIVEVDRGEVIRQLLLSPALWMFAALSVLGVLVNVGRLGTDLVGGRLLPVRDLATTWSTYLATWHPVAGGTAAPAPAALAVLGSLGAVLGGPKAAVAVLMFGDLPLAGVSAYLATRRMRVARPIRALVAATYALLPAAATAVSQGRLDVVVVHLVLPLVLAGAATLLRGNAPGTWVATVASTSIGLAVIGAFSPLTHLLVLVGVLIGFVAVPGHRRVLALFGIVLLPLALLLPWPAVVLQHPDVLLHGIGARLPDPAEPWTRIVTLDPGGPEALGVIGAFVVVAGVSAAVLRANRNVLPGLVVAVGGAVVVAFLWHNRVWTGAPMLVAGAGLLLVVLGACVPAPVVWSIPHVRFAAVSAAVVVVGVLAASALLAGRQGPLRAGGDPRFVPAIANELASTGETVLEVAHGDRPTRLTAGGLAGFGDDDLEPVPGAAERIAKLGADLIGTDHDAARAAVAQLAADGVSYIVLPDTAAAGRLHDSVGELASASPPMSDGRPVVRVQLANGHVVLLAPQQAQKAVTGGTPPAELGAPGIAPVDAAPPDIAVRVSDGPSGRLLVLAAEDEPGWRATVDGRQVATVRAWGHLIAVPVPTTAADVTVDQPGTLRSFLLLAQAAFLLFTVLVSPRAAAERGRL